MKWLFDWLRDDVWCRRRAGRPVRPSHFKRFTMTIAIGRVSGRNGPSGCEKMGAAKHSTELKSSLALELLAIILMVPKENFST